MEIKVDRQPRGHLSGVRTCTEAKGEKPVGINKADWEPENRHQFT
jgi:hypothetical protein